MLHRYAYSRSHFLRNETCLQESCILKANASESQENLEEMLLTESRLWIMKK